MRRSAVDNNEGVSLTVVMMVLSREVRDTEMLMAVMRKKRARGAGYWTVVSSSAVVSFSASCEVDVGVSDSSLVGTLSTSRCTDMVRRGLCVVMLMVSTTYMCVEWSFGSWRRVSYPMLVQEEAIDRVLNTVNLERRGDGWVEKEKERGMFDGHACKGAVQPSWKAVLTLEVTYQTCWMSVHRESKRISK